MSKTLRISDDLALPMPEAGVQTYAFIGRKRGGKTYGAGKLVELAIAAGVQVIILDSVGNWYGLRVAADGKSKGIDVPVLGGLRGDIPLEETGGELVANTLVDTGRSAILDVSTFSKSARQRFATAFGERLWLRRKSQTLPAPMLLVLEEAQLIVPEQGSSADARMVGIYTEIVRIGGNFSIGVVMITQRPQSVSKEVLNQTECLFVFQTNGAQERHALKKWIVAQGADTALLDELPSLPVGTAYVWSPQWLSTFKRVKIAQKTTFDASATLKVGAARTTRDIAPLDLNDLKTQMAATIERAKQDDPKALRAELAAQRKRVTDLEQQLQRAQNAKPEGKTKTVEKPVLRDSDIAAFDRMLAKLDVEIGEFKELAAKLDEPASKLREAARIARATAPTNMPVRHQATPQRAAVARPVPAPRATNGHAAASEVGTGGQRRIMVALAQCPDGLTVRQIGIRAGLSSKSGTFSTYISRARSSGWIDGQGPNARIRLTDAGLTALGNYDPLPTGAALLDHWVIELGTGGASRILRAVAEAYPNAISLTDVAANAGISKESGTFSTYLSRLRTLELVSGRGELTASADLFD